MNRMLSFATGGLRHLACGLMAMLCATASWSFKVQDLTFVQGVDLLTFSGAPIHETITENMLRAHRQQLPGQRTLVFGGSAIQAIVHANYRTDTADWAAAPVHFDAETFRAGSERLRDLATAIRQKSYDGDYVTSRELFGQALHTVQDFYAHSTFADKFPSGSNLVVRPRLWDPDDLLMKVDLSQASCTGQGPLLGQAVLTSGYFVIPQVRVDLGWTTDPWRTIDLALDVGLVNWPQWALISAKLEVGSWPSGKCVHGNDTGKGLNKDSPDRLNHWAARNYAALATADYIEYVLAQFSGKDYDLHLCQLMRGGAECNSTQATFVEWVLPKSGTVTQAIQGDIVTLTARVFPFLARGACPPTWSSERLIAISAPVRQTTMAWLPVLI